MSSPLHALYQVPPHRLVHGFLGDALVERLLDYAAQREGDFETTRLSKGRVDRLIRSSSVLRDFAHLRQDVEKCFLEVLDGGLRDLRSPPIHLAGLELELVQHGDGAFYREHIDTATDSPGSKTTRALAAVCYLHRVPKAFSGGALRLFALGAMGNSPRVFTDIPPDRDTLLMFPAWVPHEVRPVSCPSGAFLDSRFAINCWYRHRWDAGI